MTIGFRKHESPSRQLHVIKNLDVVVGFQLFLLENYLADLSVLYRQKYFFYYSEKLYKENTLLHIWYSGWFLGANLTDLYFAEEDRSFSIFAIFDSRLCETVV